jgi:hypothetical protein
MPDDAVIINPEPQSSLEKAFDKFTVDELFKALVDSFGSNSGDKLEYTGLLADPFETSLYQIGQRTPK